MSVKNVTVIDLALIELLGGHTDAPDTVVQQLAGKGYLTITASGSAALTATGRERAESLRDCEHDLRMAFAPGGFNTSGGCSIHG